jgi:hypothetical protein
MPRSLTGDGNVLHNLHPMPQEYGYQRMAPVRSLVSPLPPTILILLHPGSFASHGGEQINLCPKLSTYSIRWAQLHRPCWISPESLTFLSWIMLSPRCILVPVERMLVISFSYCITVVSDRVHGLPLPLATIGAASPDTVPRSSRCLDTSPRHHGTIVVSTNKSVQYICFNANRGCATDLRLTSVHRFADPRETSQHAMENTAGGTKTGCVWPSHTSANFKFCLIQVSATLSLGSPSRLLQTRRLCAARRHISISST